MQNWVYSPNILFEILYVTLRQAQDDNNVDVMVSLPNHDLKTHNLILNLA
jgi:hypothetical protein